MFKNSNNISHSMVHYLLTIHKLKEEKGYARGVDIAKYLNLTKGSVSTSLNNLKKKGLVEEEKGNKFLQLTNLGHKEVHQILSARTLLYYFFKDILKVNKDQAYSDSCNMEHLLAPITTEKFFQHIKGLSLLADSSGNKLYSMSINLHDYKTMEDFIENQEGDCHLI